MSLEDFKTFADLTSASSIKEAERKIRKRLAGTMPTTVVEYADKNNISLAEATKQLDAKGYLSQIQPFKDGSSFFGADYDGSTPLEVVDGKVVAADRPDKLFGIPKLGRFAAGLLDLTTLGLLDTDQQGGGFGGTQTGLGYNLNKYELPITKEGQEALLEKAVKKEAEKIEISPLGELINDGSSSSSGSKDGNKTILDKYQDFQQKQKDFERKNRRRDALEATVGQVIQTPIYTRLIEDAAKRRLELDKAMLGAREMMPSNIQNIMLSKQAQQQMASSAFAEEAKALAAQQDAATNFAGLGMQRKFG